MDWKGILETEADLAAVHRVPPLWTSGHAIGIIAVDLIYPKLPGNVANATTYRYPVLYHKVSFDIERLFAGDPTLGEEIIEAARSLEAQGVRAIIGACGYFAHFQDQVAQAVAVPVFLSSLCQLPLIRLGLKPGQKTLVLAASGDDLGEDLLAKVGSRPEDIRILNIGDLSSFAPIRWGRTALDNARLTKDLADLTAAVVKDEPAIGAILLECSDLPPYAAAIQQAVGLPVFDFITLIDWVEHAVVQKRYYGYF